MKRKLCFIVALLVAVITVANMAYVVKDEFFYGLDDLPTGNKLREEVNSQIALSTGYFLVVYEIPATSNHAAAIRVTLAKKVNHKTHDIRTIYWQIGTRESLIYWPENQGTFVYINGVPVDYMNGEYDCRDYDNYIYVPAGTTPSGAEGF